MGGYSLAYLFYLKGSADGKLLWSAVVSFVLLFFAGWVMHVLASVSIRPERWMEWYAPNGVIDTRGISFHSWNIPRLAFLLPLQAGISMAVVLTLFAWYFRRIEEDAPFMQWVAGRGRLLGLVVSPPDGTKREGSVSPRVERFGSIATGMLGAWFAFFILVGLYTTFFLK